MNIQQFKYILEVADNRHFDTAARKCFISQSTLSTMIGRFEEEVGISIFNRKTKPVSITPEGEKLIERLRIIQHEIDSMNNLIQEMKGEQVGELRLGVIPTISPSLLPLILPQLISQFPNVKFIVQEMTTSQIQEGLRLRNIDIGVLALPLDDEELNEYPLYKEPFLLYDCTLENGSQKASLNRLDYSRLCLLQEGHCLTTQVRKICELSDKFENNDAHFKIESGSLGSLLRLTKAIRGLTIIPYLASLDLPQKSDCRLMEFEAPVPVREVGIVTHKFFVKKGLLEAVMELMAQSVKDHLPQTGREQVMDPL
jgi:LysR family hydrogen peroxide-inducible transcriptional activator